MLRDARADGLPPGKYHVAEIERDLAGRPDRAALARADGLLQQAVSTYARDLQVPRGDTTVTYIDPELAPTSRLPRFGATAESIQQLRALRRRGPVYEGLRAGLAWYRNRWSALPQLTVPTGPALQAGSTGGRVAALRQRLGLPGASPRFDDQLGAAVRAFRTVHGLSPEPVADAATIAALNQGSAHYDAVFAANMDRARALPTDDRRYVLVDTAGAVLWMMDHGRPVGDMRVVVGKPAMSTPELAGFIRYAVLNPYWNVPPDLVRNSVAPKVLSTGPGYLAQRRFALFTDWRPTAAPLVPEAVDWTAVAAGTQAVWVRQLPGGDNMMGQIKFMLPNRLGIYLHDTPNKPDFARNNRYLSSGCVRLQDARRLGRWLFGDALAIGASGAPEQRVDLPRPVPVYVTYFTAVPISGEVRFQKDAYGRDPALIARLATPT
jgi:murein L,D-transpeptidase YcbB/YkuD